MFSLAPAVCFLLSQAKLAEQSDWASDVEVLRKSVSHDQLAARSLDVEIRYCEVSKQAAMLHGLCRKAPFDLDEEMVKICSIAHKVFHNFQAIAKDTTGSEEFEQAFAATSVRLATQVEAHLEKLGDDLRNNAPPRSVAENPQLLQQENLQKIVLDNPRKEELAAATISLANAVRFAQSILKAGVGISDRHIKSALDLKAFGKSCIGLDFALRQVLDAPQTGPAAIAAYAKEMLTILTRKGFNKSWTLPPFMNGLIASMVNSDRPAPHADAA